MDFKATIEGRRSIRRFAPTPITESELREIVTEATLAPSASNKQVWQFWAVVDKGMLEKMKQVVVNKIEEMAAWPEAKGQEEKVLGSRSWNVFFADAPACFVVLGERYQSTTDELLQRHGLSAYESDQLRARPDLQSIGGAIQTLLLSAHAKGYGTCWMTGPLVAARELEAALGVPTGWSIVSLIPIGIPAENPSARPRKSLDEVFRII